MLLRGRLTLLLLALALVVGLDAWLHSAPEEASAAFPGPPAIVRPSRPLPAGPPAPSLAPAQLLAHVPLTR